jgi:hypothetical protein
MEGNSFERLKSHILPLSASQSFNVARTEWSLVAVEISEEFDQCPCGQDIKEHCYIRNRLNGNQTYVGNVCLFDGLKRIAKDLTAKTGTHFSGSCSSCELNPTLDAHDWRWR